MPEPEGWRAEVIDDAVGDAQAVLPADRYRRIEEIGAHVIDADSNAPAPRNGVFHAAAHRPSGIVDETRKEPSVAGGSWPGGSRAAHKKMKMYIHRPRVGEAKGGTDEVGELAQGISAVQEVRGPGVVEIQLRSEVRPEVYGHARVHTEQRCAGRRWRPEVRQRVTGGHAESGSVPRRDGGLPLPYSCEFSGRCEAWSGIGGGADEDSVLRYGQRRKNQKKESDFQPVSYQISPTKDKETKRAIRDATCLFQFRW